MIKSILDLRYAKRLAEMNKRRAVYESLAESPAIFVYGRLTKDEYKDKFLDTYSKCWLWASDNVVKAIGEFLDYQICSAQFGKVEEEETKCKYAWCMLAMRKDSGFPKFSIEDSDYRFVSFSD